MRGKVINMGWQAAAIKAKFDTIKIEYSNNMLVWEGYLQPTVISRKYKVLLIYYSSMFPEVYVLEPSRLRRGPNDKLPHVYSKEEQRLCLFLRRERKWTPSKLLATTVIPWAAEWLYFYEIWIITGKWKGGGTHNWDFNIDELNTAA